MTNEGRHKGKALRGFAEPALTLLLIAASLACALLLSDELAEYVGEGISLALTRVIPTALPFMIISDIVISVARPDSLRLISAPISALLGLPVGASVPVVIGSVCGFPMGGKISAEMYGKGQLEVGAAQRAAAYSNNPSPAFVIGAVGGIMLGDRRVGAALLGCLYLSVIITAQFFRGKDRETKISYEISRQKYNFVNSVKSAGAACVSISAFIIIFACVTGLIKKYVELPILRGVLVALSEVTGAANYFASFYTAAPEAALSLIGFSLGFGGLSVLFQTAAFTADAGIGMKKYLVIKLVEGAVCAVLCYLYAAIIK